MKLALTLLALLAVAAMAMAGPGPAPEVIRLDKGQQTIENFGASDAWRMQRIGGWSLENRQKVADLLFSRARGIGLSCWRFNIGGGINPQITMPDRTPETFEISEGRYDWTRQKNERWFLEAAKQRGVSQFLAFVNSPPGRMTRNGLTFCNKGTDTSNLKPGYEPQLARYLADILEHFQASEGISFQYVSPVNEPQWDWEGHRQEGSRYSNAAIKGVVRALYAEFERRKLPTQIVLLESGNIPDLYAQDEKASARYGAKFGDYLEDFLGDHEIAPLLSGRLSYHSYGSDLLSGPITEHRLRLARAMKPFPGWKLWQSEYCVLVGPEGKGGKGRDLTMNTALDVARIIHLDLTLASVSAWQWWTALSKADFKDGLIYTDWKKPGDPETIMPSKLLWALGNYSRFVRPGMKRVTLEGTAQDLHGLMASAYLDEAGRRVVAVCVNMAESPRWISLRILRGKRHWKFDALETYLTSDAPGDDLRPLPVTRKLSAIQIPPRSVVTLVALFSEQH